MKNILKIIGLFLLITICFSCSTSESEPSLIGEYEYIDETDDKVYEARITTSTTSPSGFSWYSLGVGSVPITEVSDLTFRVSPFEIWGYINTIEGELIDKELHVTQEAFELEDIDLEEPVLVSNRIYIKK